MTDTAPVPPADGPTPPRVDTPIGNPGKPIPSSWLDRHLWQIQPIRDLLVLAAVVGLLYLGRAASVVTVPLLLALLFAYLFDPLVRRLATLRYFNRRRAVLGILAGAVLFVVIPVVVGVTAGAVQVIRLIASLADRTSLVIASVERPKDEGKLAAIPVDGPWRDIRDHLVRLRDEADPGDAELAIRWVEENARSIVEAVMSTGAGALSGTLSVLGGAFGIGMTVFFTTFFFYFISSRWPDVRAFGARLVPVKDRARVADLLDQMERVVSGFVRGRLTIALILGAFWSIGYAAIGVPAALIIGFVTGVLAIAPYAALVSLPVSILLLWLEGHAGLRGSIWWVILAPIAIYQAGQLLDDYVLTPAIQGKETDMNIPTILFAVLAGGALLGFFGLLVAIPLAACIKILIREVFWPRFLRWRGGAASDFLPIDPTS